MMAVWIIVAATAVVSGQAPTLLPADVRSALDRMHPGWRVAEVDSEVRRDSHARLGETPNVITGDFDGSGRADLAILIEYPNVDEPDKAFTHYSEIIAFLNTATGYLPVRLRDRQPAPHPIQFLTLQKRGARGFDFEANRKFIYPHDAIGEWYFEKGGGSYVYENGKFRYILEAD